MKTIFEMEIQDYYKEYYTLGCKIKIQDLKYFPRGNFNFTSTRNFTIHSANCPEINENILYIRGQESSRDNMYVKYRLSNHDSTFRLYINIILTLSELAEHLTSKYREEFILISKGLDTISIVKG